MSFKADVDATHGLTGAHRPGLQALEVQDRVHISQKTKTRLSGSVNVDAMLRPLIPNDPRWDYVIAQRRSGNQDDLLHWVEVHPASGGGNVHEMKSKAVWLLTWLRATPLAAYERRLVWVASGRCAFNARSPELKVLAGLGICFPGGRLVI